MRQHSLELELMRLARERDVTDFTREGVAWVRRRVACSTAAWVTSTPLAPAFIDAFVHAADPSGLMESFSAIGHLNTLGEAMLKAPRTVCRQRFDDPAIQAPRYAPLRAHMMCFGLFETIGVAWPLPETSMVSVLMVARRENERGFSRSDEKLLLQSAPWLVEALATNRLLARLEGARGRPVAFLDASGLIRYVDEAGRQALRWFRDESSPYAPASWLKAARGRRFLLPHGTEGQGHQLVFHTHREGHLVLIERRTDFALTPRQLEVARRYAAGASHKEIASSLSLSPATVRNHLQQIFQRLEVHSRTELARALTGGPG
jgi:DNA-binding CsgD family transcriptional regulator